MDSLQSPVHYILKDKYKKAKSPRGSHQIPACLVHGAFSEQNFKQRAAASRLIPRALPGSLPSPCRVGSCWPQQLLSPVLFSWGLKQAHIRWMKRGWCYWILWGSNPWPQLGFNENKCGSKALWAGTHQHSGRRTEGTWRIGITHSGRGTELPQLVHRLAEHLLSSLAGPYRVFEMSLARTSSNSLISMIDFIDSLISLMSIVLFPASHPPLILTHFY